MQSLSRKNKLFVHFVLDPISIPGSSDGLSFAARYGCLVLIENVSFERMLLKLELLDLKIQWS